MRTGGRYPQTTRSGQRSMTEIITNRQEPRQADEYT